jgi:hypothetical protein
MIDKWYHGTRKWEKILSEGFDIEAERVSDPGDFGWGIYFVKPISRAKCHGTVLAAAIDITDCAFIDNPYFLKGTEAVVPRTFEEELFHSLVFEKDQMKTVSGEWNDRVFCSMRVREVFLREGYAGIRTNYMRGEMVVFDPDIILNVSLA